MNCILLSSMALSAAYKYLVLRNNAVMVNLCHRQQCRLYVPVFERNYIPRCNSAANLHSIHTLHINDAFKQKNVRLPVAFFRPTVWLNRS